MIETKSSFCLASEILGVEINALETEIRYAYYRLMTVYHPDRNKGGPEAHRRSALINEAKDVLLGKEKNPTLLKDKDLVAEIIDKPIADGKIISYVQWLKENFFNLDDCSIWPCS